MTAPITNVALGVVSLVSTRINALPFETLIASSAILNNNIPIVAIKPANRNPSRFFLCFSLGSVLLIPIKL